MDPLTQGLVGAAAAVAVKSKKDAHAVAPAVLFGALGGMAPDLDILIRSSTDPLLALEYHRHFTHSFIFIPFGAFICACLSYLVFARILHVRFRTVWLWCTAGYATHALLDLCTSYGTQLLWPFTNHRFSLDIISVIDPLFTLPLLLALAISMFLNKKTAMCVGMSWCFLYLCLGAVQHKRAMIEGEAIALERGHKIERLHAKPSFANIIVWKTIYESNGHFYVDAVRLGLNQKQRWPGSSQAKFDMERDLPWLDRDSQQAKDIERFNWFSDGFIALDKNDPLRIVDMRYSLVPNEIKALWGISVSPSASSRQHAVYETLRENEKQAQKTLWAMIVGSSRK